MNYYEFCTRLTGFGSNTDGLGKATSYGMNHEKEKPEIPELSKPHPHLDDRVNRAILDSEIAGGVWLDKLEVGKKLKMVTRNNTYIIEKRSDGYYISGHPEFCPIPTKVKISGSVFDPRKSMLKSGFIGNGMFLEFIHPEFGIIKTSEIQEVTELSKEE